MSVHTITSYIAERIISAINRAVSEDVYLDYNYNGLNQETSNSFNQLVWDHIYNNLSNIDDTIGGFVKRGMWHAYTLFDPNSGCLYSVMKEKNFFRTAKKLKATPHYVQALATKINSDLEPQQLTFFSMDPDEKKVDTIVNEICNRIEIPINVVKRHKVVLFDSHSGLIKNIRCCTVDKFLEIHDSEDWTDMININEIIITNDSTKTPDNANHINNLLKLKPKAQDRINTINDINIRDNINIANINKKILF